MAAPQGPASLPHLGLFELDPVGSSQYPGPLPHVASLLAGILGGVDNPGPLPHLAMLGGLGGPHNLLDCEYGTYTVTGQDAAFRRTLTLPIDVGYMALYGQVGLLSKSAQSSGESVPLPHLATLFIPTYNNRTLTCDTGSYSILGSDAIADFEINGDTDTYTITGQDAILALGILLTAETGTYDLSGQDADSARGGPAQVMLADFGTYDLTGNDSGLTTQYALAAEHGFYALLGHVAVLSVGVVGNTTLTAEFGTYSLDGQAAGLTQADAPAVGGSVGSGDLSFLHHPPLERKKRKKPEAEGASLRKDLEKAYEEVLVAPKTESVPYLDSVKALSLQLDALAERFSQMEEKQALAERRRRKRMQQRLLVD